MNFHVLDTDQQKVALVAKKWMGCFKEVRISFILHIIYRNDIYLYFTQIYFQALTDVDNFVITFNEGLSTETKTLIFAATFLIDMMYFEMNN